MAQSLQLRLASGLIRLTVRSRLGDMRDIARLKRVFEGKTLPAPRGVRFHGDTLGGVAGEWAHGGGDRPLLFLHGGGFVGCSAKTHRPLTGAFAQRGFEVFAPGLPSRPGASVSGGGRGRSRGLARLLGAHRRPAAVAGDSAGGNLAAALLVMAKGEARRPAAAALFSPATDLTGASESWHTNSVATRCSPSNSPTSPGLYLNGADPGDPRASPLYGDLD